MQVLLGDNIRNSFIHPTSSAHQLKLLTFLSLTKQAVSDAHIFVLQGKIACANVLSDLYAMGVTECDNMLMLLAVSTKMTEKERDVVIPLIMRGFKVSTGQIIFEVTRTKVSLSRRKLVHLDNSIFST